MTQRKSRLSQIAIKAESVPGTAETSFANSNAPVLVYDYSISFDQQQNERVPFSPYYGAEPDIPGMRRATVTFRTELTPASNHSTTEPPWAPFLKACGFVVDTLETVAVTSVSGEFTAGDTITDSNTETAKVARHLDADGTLYLYSVSDVLSAGSITGALSGSGTIGGDSSAIGRIYHPTSTEASHAHSTLRVYNDGHLDVIAGALGNVTLECETGAPVALSFEFTGKLLAPDSAAVLTGTKPATLPNTFKAVGLTLEMGSAAEFSPDFQSLSLNTGNAIDLPPNANESTGAGYSIAVIENRQSSGSIAAIATTQSDHDWLQHFQDADYGPMSFNVGSTSNQRFTIHCPRVQYMNPQEGDIVGRKQYTFDLGLKRNVGDDELLILCY